MRVFSLSILLLLLFFSSPAQYRGGGEDGLNTVIANAINLASNGGNYQGGINDGNHLIKANGFSLAATGNPYNGGPNDGIASTIANIKLRTPDMFTGGRDDGIGTGVGIALLFGSNSMFTGGTNDGITAATSLGLGLTSLQTAYTGGADDGVGITINTATTLSTNTMYTGGTNDGFNSLLKASAKLGTSTLYSGGDNDGYATISKTILLVLPVKWLMFTVTKREQNVLLNWQTASMLNIAGFEIERSSDGVQFTKIGYQNAAITNGSNQYQFTDIDPARACSGSNCDVFYYRLKQISIGQPAEISPVRQIRFSGKGINYNIFPNPASDKLTINASSGTQRTLYNINLYNNIGILIFSKENISNQFYEVPVSQFVSGIYYLKLTTEGTTTTFPIFIKH